MREAVTYLETVENLWSWRIRLGCEFQNNKFEILSTGLELLKCSCFRWILTRSVFLRINVASVF